MRMIIINYVEREKRIKRSSMRFLASLRHDIAHIASSVFCTNFSNELIITIIGTSFRGRCIKYDI